MNANLLKMASAAVGVLLLLFPISVVAECICDGDGDDADSMNKSAAQIWLKLTAIASILTASGIGILASTAVCGDGNFFLIMKANVAGIILSTEFVHILPDAIESSWRRRDFPSAGFAAMVAVIGALMGETDLKSHAWAGAEAEAGVLEMGMNSLKSMVIGIALGASLRPNTISPLFFALIFLQFFQGCVLGNYLKKKAKKKKMEVCMGMGMALLTVPSGICIGIWLSSIDDTMIIIVIQRIFSSFSAGILIHMALVDLMATSFTSPNMNANQMLQWLTKRCLLVTAACTSAQLKLSSSP